MRKYSQMGTSKYEFNPEQFEIDVSNNLQRYSVKKQTLSHKIHAILKEDPVRMDESFSMLLDILREVKTDYKL